MLFIIAVATWTGGVSAVDEEPMDVDNTGNIVKNIPFVGDMSVIQPRDQPGNKFLSVPGRSPVKAGMDTPASPYDVQGPRQPRRSPRTSSMPPPGSNKVGGSGRKIPSGQKSGSGTTPQNGGRPVKRTLKHSVSASVLPRNQAQQPASFR